MFKISCTLFQALFSQVSLSPALFFPIFIFALAFYGMHAAQEPVRPKKFYARYHDPAFGAPIKVRYVPTKQEDLEYDIQNFFRANLLVCNLAQHRPSNAQFAAQRAALFARTLMHGTTQQATALLAANADPNSPDSTGSLPLHTATKYTNMPVLELLVTAKADIQAPDQQGNTVLNVAVHKENPALICALLSFGANPESPDQHGETILAYLEKRKKEYLVAQEECKQNNTEYARKNNGEEFPTFQAVMKNLQAKLDTLYTICATIKKAEKLAE